jgi:hypothetical protein
MSTVESRSVNPLLLICNPPSWAKTKQNKILEIEFFFIKNRTSSSSSSSCTKISRNLIVNLAPWKKSSKKICNHPYAQTSIQKKSKKFDFFVQKSREMRSIFLSHRNRSKNAWTFSFFCFAVKEWRSWIDAALGLGWCLLKKQSCSS